MQESIDYGLNRYMIAVDPEEGEGEYETLGKILEAVSAFYRDHPTYEYFGIEAVNDTSKGAYAIIWYTVKDA